MSNIEDLIERRGEPVSIYRRSESGVDEFNRPVYTWTLQAVERAFIQPVGQASGVGEVITRAGELAVDDRVGFFPPDSAVQDDDQVEWAGSRYDVEAVQSRRVGGATVFKVALLRRLVE
ncbi:MAG: hypothetical protein ACE5OO_08800 [Candidatus Bathyarchaeia archaeon]